MSKQDLDVQPHKTAIKHKADGIFYTEFYKGLHHSSTDETFKQSAKILISGTIIALLMIIFGMYTYQVSEISKRGAYLDSTVTPLFIEFNMPEEGDMLLHNTRGAVTTESLPYRDGE